jgi:hypothetical protein
VPKHQSPQDFLNSQLYFGQIGFSTTRIKRVDDEDELEFDTVMDVVLEKDISMWLEFNVNHADEVIDILKKAYKAAKKINSHRSLLFLGREIARENFLNKRFLLAKPLYDNLLQTYRKESWTSLLCATLQEVIVCARELKLPSEIVKYCLEMLGRGNAKDSFLISDFFSWKI